MTVRSVVQVRVDEPTRLRWQAAAERDGVSLSEWLRSAAERELGSGPAGGSTPSPVASVEAVEPRVSGPEPSSAPVSTAGAVMTPVFTPALSVARATKREKRRIDPASGMCEHRVPAGSYCGLCEATPLIAVPAARDEAVRRVVPSGRGPCKHRLLYCRECHGD